MSSWAVSEALLFSGRTAEFARCCRFLKSCSALTKLSALSVASLDVSTELSKAFATSVQSVNQ